MSDRQHISNASGPASAADPSMDEILASIRRVLKDEGATSDELVLDATMRVLAPEDVQISATQAPFGQTEIEPEETAPQAEIIASVLTLDNHPDPVLLARLEKDIDMEDHLQRPAGLIGDQVATEIASSVGSLLRSVNTDRSASIGRPGLTIEDIVREEIKPVLKSWLDTNLPGLVERVVRAEINRVMELAKD